MRDTNRDTHPERHLLPGLATGQGGRGSAGLTPLRLTVNFRTDAASGPDSASTCRSRRGQRPWHVRKLFAREPGGLGFGRRTDTAGPHREDEEPEPMMHETREDPMGEWIATSAFRESEAD